MSRQERTIFDMVERREILRFVDQVAELFRPEKIILFGSYANGTPTFDSDVDILVVKHHRGPGHETATRIRGAIPREFPMDLIVRSPAELRRGVAEKDWFIIDVLENGITLYDAANRAVGAKGRKRLERHFALAAVSQARSI